jgi:hypothetical protein
MQRAGGPEPIAALYEQESSTIEIVNDANPGSL